MGKSLSSSNSSSNINIIQPKAIVAYLGKTLLEDSRPRWCVRLVFGTYTEDRACTLRCHWEHSSIEQALINIAHRGDTRCDCIHDPALAVYNVMHTARIRRCHPSHVFGGPNSPSALHIVLELIRRTPCSSTAMGASTSIAAIWRQVSSNRPPKEPYAGGVLHSRASTRPLCGPKG